MQWIAQHNARQNHGRSVVMQEPVIPNDSNYLLPMAFPEGSPMHPSYGAGHATVAGACVTVLKAFFNTLNDDGTAVRFGEVINSVSDLYVPAADRQTLVPAKTVQGVRFKDVTLEGELNKLAANIAIGRNMAGVHYYTDYYDSLRLGERLAVGLLEEQMLNYQESVSMTFHSFDNDVVSIRTDGGTSTGLLIRDESGRSVDRGAWWTRHVKEFEQCDAETSATADEPPVKLVHEA